MHPANLAWWNLLRTGHPEWFTNRRVLEAGSFDVNGSVRQFFRGGTYLGLDWRPGPGVDVVCLAHQFTDAVPYDTIISASMLEHDPFWESSLTQLVELLAEGGPLLLSWGAAGNGVHCIETAPDAQFHALPAGRVLALLAKLGCTVVRFQYESEVHREGTLGEVGCAAIKGEAVVEYLSPLQDADVA